MRVLLVDASAEEKALARRLIEREIPGTVIAELDGGFEELLAQERQARSAAEEASAMKDEFLATLSHELRTPLNAIVGWAALLRASGPDGERFERAVESIERNARSQARLIDDLLDVSAIISGRMKLDTRPLDLVPVVEAALDAVRPAADTRSVRLEPVLDDETGPVTGDPDRLQQVVWNLLSNAVKFTPPGGVVRVSLLPVKDQACITVHDTGQGIAPAFLPHVFEPFRQADGSTSRAQGGLGLGLAIVRRVVELHGGRVEAESDGPGHGATFRVHLPLRPRPGDRRAETVATAAITAATALDCPPNLRHLKVLVVDDDPDARDLVAVMLEKCDADVRLAASVAEAMEVFAGFRPDVLLCDLAMPVEDGFDLIRRLRALPADAGGRVPAAALTAYARAEDRRRALLAGFNMHVTKPIDPAELLAVVASLGGRVDFTQDLP